MTKTVSGVRLAALLSLVMLAAPPSVALAQGVAPAQASEAIATVSVDAQKPWVDTGVDLKAGEALTISANGRWTNGGNPPYFAGPDGFAGVTLPEATLNSASFAALIGKVGDQVFFVGSAYRGTSPAAGRLYLQINDIANANCFADNSGKMDVEVRHPAAVSKTPGMFGIKLYGRRVSARTDGSAGRRAGCQLEQRHRCIGERCGAPGQHGDAHDRQTHVQLDRRVRRLLRPEDAVGRDQRALPWRCVRRQRHP